MLRNREKRYSSHYIEGYMIVDCVADLHGYYPKMPGGDLLIIAGDCTSNDKISSWGQFFNWIDHQKYRKKVMIAGNHDNWCKNWALSGTFSKDEYQQIYPGENPSVEYLCDSGIEFEGFKIWGSPWTSRFEGINPHCCAFTGADDKELFEKFDLIPSDTDILITHSPPFTVRDMTTCGKQVGSPSLMALHMKRLRPKLWVFGHIHEGYGQDGPYQWNGTKYVNASHVNERYQPINQPIRIILEEKVVSKAEESGKD